MPHHLPKLFRIRLEQALKAVGSGESVVDTLDTLRNEGVIESYDTILEIRVNRDKAAALEHFFLLQDFGKTIPIKRSRGE